MPFWFSIITIVASALNAEDRATATGTVVDASGKLLEYATVIVHSAGLRTGYGIFCPTCYTGCGKRALADQKGAFSIRSPDPQLLFTLLVVKEGYSTQYSDNVDPANPVVIGLKPRPAIADASQIMGGGGIFAPARQASARRTHPTASGAVQGARPRSGKDRPERRQTGSSARHQGCERADAYDGTRTVN